MSSCDRDLQCAIHEDGNGAMVTRSNSMTFLSRFDYVWLAAEKLRGVNDSNIDLGLNDELKC